MKDQTQMLITKYDLLYEQRMTRVETVMETMAKNFEYSNKRLDEALREIKTDFRWLVVIMLSGFGLTWGMIACLFGLMAHGFKWF